MLGEALGGIQLRLARIALLTGAVVDALAALQLMLPTTFSAAGFAGLRSAGGAGQMAIESAALLLGWSAIEVWASRQPLERRAIIYVGLTVLAVFLVQNAWLLGTGQVEAATTLPLVVLQVGLVALFAVAVVKVRTEPVPA